MYRNTPVCSRRVKSLFLVQINPNEEKQHCQHDEYRHLKLVGEEKSAEHRREYVGRGRAVLLHHVVQPLQDGRHHQASDTAEQEAQQKEDLHLAGRGVEVMEDDAGAEVGDGQDVDKTGHHHPVQVEPELLGQEILSGILKSKLRYGES